MQDLCKLGKRSESPLEWSPIPSPQDYSELGSSPLANEELTRGTEANSRKEVVSHPKTILQVSLWQTASSNEINLENEEPGITLGEDFIPFIKAEPVNLHHINRSSTIIFKTCQLDDQLLAPWMSEQTRQISNPWERLHHEMIEFREYIRPPVKEWGRRSEAIERVKRILLEVFPGSEVVVIGSSATQLYLPGADIDIVVISSLSRYQMLRKTADRFQYDPKFDAVEVQLKTRLPLVRINEISSQYVFDISFNKLTGIEQVMEMAEALDTYPELSSLFMIFKLVLAQRYLNQTYYGGVGSYLLYCLCVTFVKTKHEEIAESVQETQKEGKTWKPVLLSELLMGMMSFYTSSVDWKENYIQMQRLGGRVVKKARRSPRFSVLLAKEYGGYEIGQQSFRMGDFLGILKPLLELLTNHHFQPGHSILKFLVNVSGQDFATGLQHLAD